MRSTQSRVLILTIAILAFTIAISAIGFWKYAHYRYGGMDLAIYTNVLWNLSGGGEEKNISPLPAGRGGFGGEGKWYSSIQGGSYLGDHVEPILIFLVPFFRLWSDPRLLLILQALALGLTSVPIFLLLAMGENSKSEVRNSKQIQNSNFKTSGLFRISPPKADPPRAEDSGFRISWPVALAGLWLLNPLLWNAALFEFHAIAFAPLFLLSAAYSYLQRRFWWFLFWSLLSLSVREDIALIVVMFGVIACIDKWYSKRQRGARATRRTISGDVAAVARCAAWGALESAAADSRRGIPHASEEQRPTSGATGAERWHRDLSWRFAILPIILGFVWFLIATHIAAAHSASGAYKFLVYYGWLGEVASHPLALLRHFLSIGNLDMVLGLLLPFLFLPAISFVVWIARGWNGIIRIMRQQAQKSTIVTNWAFGGGVAWGGVTGGTWLLLALPPLLQILLAEPGGSNVVVELHYGLLFLPALVLASIEAINIWQLQGEHSNASNVGFECLECTPRYSEHSNRIRSIRMFLQRRFPLPKPFAITLGIATYLAAAWMLGPFPGIADAALRGASTDQRARAAAYDELLQIVQSLASDNSGVSIAAGYAALPHIAARRGAYALPYAYLGVNQYAFAPYVLPEDLQFMLLDQRDALAYAVQFPAVRWSAPYAAEGPSRLQKIIADGRFGIVAERDGVVVLERNVFPEQAKRVSAEAPARLWRGCAFGAEESPCMIDQRYFSPNYPVRGRLIIDPLRDIVVQLD